MRELEPLTALAERHDRIVSREELYWAVWEAQYRKSDRSIDVYVARLRQKLNEAIPGGTTSTHTSGSATGCRRTDADSSTFTPFLQGGDSWITD